MLDPPLLSKLLEERAVRCREFVSLKLCMFADEEAALERGPLKLRFKPGLVRSLSGHSTHILALRLAPNTPSGTQYISTECMDITSGERAATLSSLQDFLKTSPLWGSILI